MRKVLKRERKREMIVFDVAVHEWLPTVRYVRSMIRYSVFKNTTYHIQ